MIYQKTDLELVVAVFAVLEFSWGVAGKWPLGDRPLHFKCPEDALSNRHCFELKAYPNLRKNVLIIATLSIDRDIFAFSKKNAFVRKVNGV